MLIEYGNKCICKGRSMMHLKTISGPGLRNTPSHDYKKTGVVETKNKPKNTGPALAGPVLSILIDSIYELLGVCCTFKQSQTTIKKRVKPRLPTKWFCGNNPKN